MKVAGHERSEIDEIAGYDHGQVVVPAMPLLLNLVGRVCSK